MFGVILVFVVTLMQGYVFWRAASVPFVRRHLSRNQLIGLGIALWVLFVLGRVIGMEDTGSMAVMLEVTSMVWMAVLFLTSVSLSVLDIASGFGFFHIKPELRGFALAVGGLLSVVALIQGLRAPLVQNYDVYLNDLPENLDGTVIAALSDLHLGAVLGERWLLDRVEQVRQEKPDVIVLLGDVFEGHGTPGRELTTALRHLSAPKGVWAVLGNHEHHGNDNTAVFEKAGIHLLRNAWVELSPGLILAGMDDSATGNTPTSSLRQTLAGRPPGATVLLPHAPQPAIATDGKGVNLMLSGHTHGGQIWPFGYLVMQLFPMIEGRYESGGMTILVSRGTGTWGPRMRLWQPAEIFRVTLHSPEKLIDQKR